MTFRETQLPGVIEIEPELFGDARGFFMEVYQREKYRAAGIDVEFVQENHSRSALRVLRGLHYQLRHPQGKLMRAVVGEIFDVAVDLRRASPHFGEWAGAVLSAENRRLLYIPPGFAHGFCVTSEVAEVVYQCTDYYDPEDERGILWSDPEIDVHWPITQPILSRKDQHHPLLCSAVEQLPE
ncbi:MAG: dTDP-4-dehydrorhamnose 3,5-epimerase [Nitrospirae bacterium CG18_big_fil_WC_8_21_14_2_50_70_55]|nr:dTDP-4-dehydrorhamnose 3,5-epimerase [Deltaproteobacteria bacterium]OIP66593.1 MAG: dTDP-4-dehydrorhamnose 3,5-epimerase [Nitrospirae bacterium CG2_30_70_394]PIQ05675.1 MAG: dTDP-4-dehydrorhamnose 3,5-epimerase [Nitrospirae bacterium CG18_big_fil_WC_8_21_14_2_50_70_55]PIU77235.1 MAG: dTDP-4-dehydrorhamnose 3,5-epimerase [Nitrospirae bacterium CG06_land_8_20_14_3_00_70_43]PIW82740.1 MAG: dTDP-4-dehydrorhamnose 3,5-epimerase [Nitrospirae bacterium CG_4_8_14_3_um_filter_70_85]PIX82559.1 MAG: d